jgi:hypothetical protein
MASSWTQPHLFCFTVTVFKPEFWNGVEPMRDGFRTSSKRNCSDAPPPALAAARASAAARCTPGATLGVRVRVRVGVRVGVRVLTLSRPPPRLAGSRGRHSDAQV